MNWLIIGGIPVFLLACTPSAIEPSSEQYAEKQPLAPPLPGQGLQLRMTKTIAAGNESYGCRLFQMPDEDLFVHEQTVDFSAGGHHILLYKTPYVEIPERDVNGEFVVGSEVHDCSEGVTARWKVESVLGGSEIFDHPGMFRGLPDGVAVRLPKKNRRGHERALPQCIFGRNRSGRSDQSFYDSGEFSDHGSGSSVS